MGTGITRRALVQALAACGFAAGAPFSNEAIFAPAPLRCGVALLRDGVRVTEQRLVGFTVSPVVTLGWDLAVSEDVEWIAGPAGLTFDAYEIEVPGFATFTRPVRGVYRVEEGCSAVLRFGVDS